MGSGSLEIHFIKLKRCELKKKKKKEEEEEEENR